MKDFDIEQGRSNILRLDMQKGQCALLHKFFDEKLVCYDTCWPLSRMEVEIAVNHRLQELIQTSVSASAAPLLGVPIIHSIQKASHSYTMEYLHGQTLWQIFSGRQTSSFAWDLTMAHIKALVSLLYRVSHIRASDFDPDTQKAFRAQRAVVSCMYHNKIHHSVPILSEDQGCLCLGDVSINNLIFDTKRLCLIDFECAHFGYPGYDLGQLLGMVRAYAQNYPDFAALYQQISTALSSEIRDPAYLSQVQKWEHDFFDYYIK